VREKERKMGEKDERKGGRGREREDLERDKS
jgi:hypothetical protein